MIKISFELKNGYVHGWHEVTQQYPAMFANTVEFRDVKNGKKAEEQLQYFNDNYLNYTLRDGALLHDESNNGFEKAKQAAIEQRNKVRRAVYMDAYRKYQAAVNYKEFKRIPAADKFIRRLRDKDWTAFENIPAEIKYFAGECNFDKSGLVALNI